MRNTRILHLILFLLSSTGFSNAQSIPSFQRNASVHDPSVIKVDDRYYVYGSHGASAWSTDLMNWTQVARGVTLGNPPHFRTFQSELSEMISWTNATTLWAADVYKLADGKYYYYYNVWTDLHGYRSYLGVARSDHIEGPFEDLGELLRGGTGVPNFDPRNDPNTIDPTLFRDTENQLWMVYGSYSGGIFVLEMDDQTGFSLPNQDWGTRINGGNHSVMEGPFIDYNSDTGFYYLFLSYGGLAAADGYNMRVFRSEHPTGPFRDPLGTDMSTAALNSSLSTIAPHGLKLAGNWQFLPAEGEPASSATGYLSPGHNSVIQDPDTGKWFNIFHTRFVGRGEEHEVRVHQLFFNEDGWPVMAPHRYAGETQGSYTTADIAGSYKVIDHGKDITGDVKTSIVVGLQENGGLVGAIGSWTMLDDTNIEIEMNDSTYKGVVATFWDNENRMWVNGFTAISTTGASLWGSELAISDRTGELDPPDFEPIPDMAIAMDEELHFVLNNRANNSDLLLEYKILSGPEGLTLNPSTWTINWIPQATQMGKVFNIRIQVYDIIEPNLADEVAFSIYVGGGYRQSEVTLSFESLADEGILDKDGKATGLTTRLSGTGLNYASNDPNLTIFPSENRLKIQSTQSDFNGQSGVELTSAVGKNLSELGFTGTEDFSVTADFEAVVGLENIDQIGVFVGNAATTLTRAGIIQTANPEGLGVHTENGADTSATFNQSAFDLSDGLQVTIARENAEWSYIVDGVSVAPQSPNATFLDALSDLTVGVFAINPLNTNSKTVSLNSLQIFVTTDQLRVTRIEEWKTEHFGSAPAIGVAGNNDDPDKDGNSNLVEYALGSDPLVFDSDPNHKVEVTDGVLVWTISQRDDPSLSYEIISRSSQSDAIPTSVWRSAAGNNQNEPIQIEAPLPETSREGLLLQLLIDSVE